MYADGILPAAMVIGHLGKDEWFNILPVSISIFDVEDLSIRLAEDRLQKQYMTEQGLRNLLLPDATAGATLWEYATPLTHRCFPYGETLDSALGALPIQYAGFIQRLSDPHSGDPKSKVLMGSQLLAFVLARTCSAADEVSFPHDAGPYWTPDGKRPSEVGVPLYAWHAILSVSHREAYQRAQTAAYAHV